MDNNLNIKTLHVCRTCMKETNASFFHLDFTQIDGEPTIGQKISNCIPELDLIILLNTVICGKCADTINSLYIFKNECMELEMHIREYIQEVQHTGNVIDLAAVMQFHQQHSKNLTGKLKTKAFEQTENYKNEESPTSFTDNYAFTETKGNTEIETSFIKMEKYEYEESPTFFTDNYAFNETKGNTEIETGSFEKTENYKNESITSCDNYAFFINSNQSEAEHDDSNIVQECLLQVVENSDSCIEILNEPDIYYQCFRCGHKAESKLKLIRHLKSHTDKKPFKCSVCEYSCKQKRFLKQHQLIHTGEKPYKCSVCEHSCNRKSNLKIHMQTHRGEKPFKCSVCEHSFTLKSNLNQHLLTHTNEKPFKCSVCEYSCNLKKNLTRHMLTHTRKKPFIHTSIKPFMC